MIIVCGGIKGGSGKTTLATNLAVLRARGGYNVMLVDGDEQGTATDFLQLRAERHPELPSIAHTAAHGLSLRQVLPQHHSVYPTVIVDVGGRDTVSQRSALSVADLFLVPFLPRSFDLWTIEGVLGMVQELRSVNDKLETRTVINRAESQGRYALLSRERLIEAELPDVRYLGLEIGSRVAFAHAAADGLGVVELPRKDTRAIAEMDALYTRIFESEDPNV